MRLPELIEELILRGKPELNVGCYSENDGDTQVQIRLLKDADSPQLHWTWFRFMRPCEGDMTSRMISELYGRASASDEWYLDEISIDDPV